MPETDKLIPPPPAKEKDKPPYTPPLSGVHQTFVYDPVTGKEVRQW